jgi:hypothetical protein
MDDDDMYSSGESNFTVTTMVLSIARISVCTCFRSFLV